MADNIDVGRARISELLQILGDGITTCYTSTEIWARIEGLGDAVVPGLQDRIMSENEDIARLALAVTREAIEQRTRLDLAPLVPTIIRALNRSAPMQIAAAMVLGALGESAALALPDVMNLSESRKAYVAAHAVAAALGIDPCGIELLTPKVIEMLRCDDCEAQRVTVEAVAKLGSKGSHFVPELKKLIEEGQIVADAAAAIFKVTSDPTPLLDHCNYLLASEDRHEVEYGKELLQQHLDIG